MAETKWTPGPWYEVKLWDGRNQIRARVGHREVVVANDVSRGDVPLILAVHDLREACEAALHAFNTNPTDRFLTPEEEDAIEKLRSALAKARGEEVKADGCAQMDDA